MKKFLLLLLALVFIGINSVSAQDRYCRLIDSDCQYPVEGEAEYWFKQGEWVEVAGKSNGDIIVEGNRLPTDKLKFDKHNYTINASKKILTQAESALGAECFEWFDQKSQIIKVNNKENLKEAGPEIFESTFFRLKTMPEKTDSICVYNNDTRELVCILKDTASVKINQSIKSLKLVPNNRVSSVISDSIKTSRINSEEITINPQDTNVDILHKNRQWILLGLVLIVLIVLLIILKPWKNKVLKEDDQFKEENPPIQGDGNEIDILKSKINRLSQDKKTLELEIKNKEHTISQQKADLDRVSSERDNAQKIAQESVKHQIEEGIRTAKEDAKKQIEKAEQDAKKRVEEAVSRANAADEKAEKKVAEAKAQAKAAVEKVQTEATAKVNKAKAEADTRVNKAQSDANALIAQTKADADKAITTEKQNCESKLEAMRQDMECYTKYLVSVRPALEYTKTVSELLELMKQMKAAAFELLENDAVEDPYYIYKAISKYEKNLENLDESKLLTDIKLLLDTNFVLTTSQLSQFDQGNGFDDSMRQYYFNYYLEKIFNAIVVFNETLIGIQYFIEGLDTSSFVKYREEIRNFAEKLSIDYAVLEIHSGLKVSEDVKIMQMVDAGWSDPGLVVEIENCIVYMRGANRPETKIYIKVQE